MDHLDAAQFNPPTLADVVWNLVDALALLTELATGGELTRDHVEALDRASASLGDAAQRSGLPAVAERYRDARGQLRRRFGNS